MWRFVSWNVNGIRALEKKGFADTALGLQADILAVQETKARPEQLGQTLRDLPGYLSYWHSAERKGYSGVGVYVRQEPLNVTYGIGSPEHDAEGRAIVLEYPDFFFLNLYFPNAQPGLVRLDHKLAFNAAVFSLAERLRKERNVVLCGDFNVAHRPIDLANPEKNEGNPGYCPEERAWMNRFLEAGYVDTFRMFHEGPGHYTWWTYRFGARARNIGWRIDYFCVDAPGRNRIKDAAILKEVMGSDHCPISLCFE